MNKQLPKIGLDSRDSRFAPPSQAVGQAYVRDAEPQAKAQMLRNLADWYRAFASHAANPAIWESRLRTAEELEAEAGRVDRQQSGGRSTDAA